jgi:hypothetical protein
MMSATATNYDQLCAAADQLRKSERGQRALKNLSAFFREGGLCLDQPNKQAAMRLFRAALENPWDLPAELT